MKQFIATILIIGLVLSLNLNLFLIKPKTVQAFSSVEGQVTAGATTTTAIGTWAHTIKEVVLDAIGWVFADTILKPLEQRIMNWGLGRTSAANEPFLIVDWGEFFKQALIVGTAKFIAEYDLIWDTADDLDNRIKGTLDSLGFNRYYEEFRGYSEYARTTLYSDLGPDRYQPFINSGYSLRVGGWPAWFSMLKPQNNVFGQIMMASYARRQMMEAEKEAKANQAQAAHGYKNEEATTKTSVEQCVEQAQGEGTSTCRNRCVTKCNISLQPDPTGAIKQACLNSCYAECDRQVQIKTNNCQARPEVSLQTKIKNWGQHIETYMTDALGADMARIISADEISELIGIIFSALLNKAVSGLGLGFSAKTSTPKTRARADYKDKFSYGRSFKKSQTKNSIQDVRTNVLNSILSGMQSLDRSLIRCKESEQMTYEDWTKQVAEVLETSVEALYVGLVGANLRPDFEVLDSGWAPYTVYGYSWGHIPYSKMPPACRAITDQLNLGSRATCMNIISGLEPLDPTFNELACPTCTPPTAGFTYSGTCSQCMYDHDGLACPPGETPLLTQGVTIPETILKQKATFYNTCLNWYTNQTLNRCEECIKKADEKCSKLDGTKERQCIVDGGFCDNYGDVSEHIQGTITDTYIDPNTMAIVPGTAGLDFYDKCVIEEKKDACFTCLKEYYVPATYCDQINDYVVRSIDKYPAIVKIIKSGADDKAAWFGPWDSTQCEENYNPKPMDLALMCRIAPDFSLGRGKLCPAMCMGRGMTEAELQDITDFRPNGADCNNTTINIGGRDAWNATADGVVKIRGKCCGALNISNSSAYSACVGKEATTKTTLCSGKPFYQEPQCYCENGERPVARTKNRLPSFECPNVAGIADGTNCWDRPDQPADQTICRKNCDSSDFTVPNMTGLKDALIRTNAAPGGSMVYIGTERCTNDGDCYADLAQASILEKIAQFFKPLILHDVYAQDCNCNSRADCDEGERCRFAGAECRGEPYTGTCEEIPPWGTCNCTETDLSQCSPGQYCDLDAPSSGECLVGNKSYTGLCKTPSEPPPGDGCTWPGSYSSPTPNGIICSGETLNTTNTKNCCLHDPHNPPGQSTASILNVRPITCNLSGRAGENLFLGVYNNQAADCQTSATLCVPCNSTLDPEYPNYGRGVDQCNNKVPPGERGD